MRKTPRSSARAFTASLSMGGNGHYIGNPEIHMNVGEAIGKVVVERLMQ